MHQTATSISNGLPHIKSYRQQIEDTILTVLRDLPEPPELYEPFRYSMAKPGKYMRPLMTMLSSALRAEASREALYAGIAIEIMHTFTLVHDDIMDKSPLRRGMPSVHTKWDESTAILSGDVMMGVAYQLLLDNVRSPQLAAVLRSFTKGFIEVCEGQALDVAFGTRENITMDEYLLMIEKKTARLPEIAAQIGAILAEASDVEQAAISTFAREAGIAFQIQDDLLDLTADQLELGKKVGQDILEGKKTYLIVRSIEKAVLPSDRELFQRFLQHKGLAEDEISTMRDVIQRLGVFEDAEREVQRRFEIALHSLDILPEGIAKSGLRALVEQLRVRKK